jgi:signal transduction histidine kinase
MESLVRDLLDWSRTQRGGPIPVSTRESELDEVCRRVADEFQERERIRVEREGDTRARFDPDRMQQVVGNLLVNALRYAPPGTPVVVRAVGASDEVRVEVHDQGRGIPPEEQPAIFEAFQRGRGEVGSGLGLGLGLFIVRAVAEAHGGRVDVTSAPGRTTFVVRLPRAAPPVAEAMRREA